MRPIIWLVLGGLSAGCFYVGADDYEAILRRPSAEWSSRDRLTVIAAVAQTNLQDKGVSIYVTAIPYYPSVITAINRSIQAQHKLGEEEYERNIALTVSDDTLSSLLQNHSQLLNENGSYHKELIQLDSLMFYISLTNRAWPCANPLIETQIGSNPTQRKMVPLFSSQNDIPCPTPDITNLADNVYLVNDQNLHLHPKVIWGRRHETLTTGETLLMMFQLRSGEYHFFKRTKKTMKMVIKGLENEIAFEFPISKVR